MNSILHTAVRVILLNGSSLKPTLQNITLVPSHIKQGKLEVYRLHDPKLPLQILFSTPPPPHPFLTILKEQRHKAIHVAFALLVSSFLECSFPRYLHGFSFHSFSSVLIYLLTYRNFPAHRYRIPSPPSLPVLFSALFYTALIT